jgi:hypothetical protein
MTATSQSWCMIKSVELPIKRGSLFLRILQYSTHENRLQGPTWNTRPYWSIGKTCSFHDFLFCNISRNDIADSCSTARRLHFSISTSSGPAQGPGSKRFSRSPSPNCIETSWPCFCYHTTIQVRACKWDNNISAVYWKISSFRLPNQTHVLVYFSAI